MESWEAGRLNESATLTPAHGLHPHYPFFSSPKASAIASLIIPLSLE